MANTIISRSVSSSGNRQKFTISMWLKRNLTGAGVTQYLLSQGSDSNNNFAMYFDSSNTFGVWDYGSGYNGRLATNRIFRDPSGWYHIVVRVDTTLGTAGDRMRLYINGVQETSFSTSTNFSSDFNTHVNQSGNPIKIGGYVSGSEGFDGIISHIHLCDGYSYGPDSFGQTNSTTGEWSIKTSPSVSYGTNGFWWLKNDIATTDHSPNSNSFTVSTGTLTKTEDCPSNVFATMNPLNVPTSNAPSFSNGNTTSISSSSGSGKWGGSTTLGMTSGKWYCEAKATVDNTYSRNVIGITGDSANIAKANGSILNGTHSWGWYSENGAISGNGSANIQTGTTYGTGDIVMMALDLDNNKLYFGKNGSWVYSGVPTSGSTGTGAISIIASNTTNDGAYFFAQNDDTGTSAQSKFEWNFGNGYFGTTAVSSAGTNASNNGIFEYDVPTGYTALSTKGLNL